MTPATHIELYPPSARSGWWGLVACQFDGPRSFGVLAELPGVLLPGSDRLAARVRNGIRDLECALDQHAPAALAFAYNSGSDPLVLDALWRLGEEVTLPVPLLLDDVPKLLRFLEGLDVLTNGEIEAVGVLRDWLKLREEAAA